MKWPSGAQQKKPFGDQEKPLLHATVAGGSTSSMSGEHIVFTKMVEEDMPRKALDKSLTHGRLALPRQISRSAA